MNDIRRAIDDAKSFEELATLVETLTARFQNEISRLKGDLQIRIDSANLEVAQQNAATNERIRAMTEAIANTRKRARETTDADASRFLQESAHLLEENLETLKESFSTLAQTTGIINALDQKATQMVLAPLHCLMKKLKRPILVQLIMDFLWGLILLTLIINNLLEKISSKAASLYLIPTCLFFLQKYFLDGWFRRITLESRKAELRSITANAENILTSTEALKIGN